MQNFGKKSCVLLLFAILIINCKHKDNPTDSGTSEDTGSSFIVIPKDDVKLEGRVKDEQGNSISGVDVHYSFELKSKSLSKPNNTCPSTVISFTIPAPTHVKIVLLRWYTRDTISIISDTDQPSGNISVAMSTANLTSGFYLIQIIANNKTIEKVMYIQNTDYSVLYNSTPLASSNQDGYFSLPRGIFGMGYPIIQVDATGNVLDSLYVSPKIKLVLHKAGYETLMPAVDLNDLGSGEKQFIMTKAAK